MTKIHINSRYLKDDWEHLEDVQQELDQEQHSRKHRSRRSRWQQENL
jgi:hypothetical protein